MFLKSKFFRVVCALSLLLALFTLAVADTIRLKDGSIIKGKIINFTGGQFTVLIGEGSRQRRMNFYADEIESIEFDSTSMPVATVKTTTQLPQKTNSSNTSTNDSNNDSNTTVITVGQTNKPVTVPSSTPTQTETNTNTDTETIIVPAANTSSNTNPTTTTTTAKPIQLKVKVLADNTANGWTNSGWVVKKGQKIKITSNGNISLGSGKNSSPNGIASLADKDKLMAQEATGGLIAVVGDDNNEFIFIGANREFTATRDGQLFLGINEGNLNDNSGSFEVSIEIRPEI